MNADLRCGCFYLLCSSAAFAYAVGHPYPPICIAKEIKPRNLRAQCFNPCYALQVADLCYVINKGKVAFVGDPGELQQADRMSGLYLGTHA